MSSDISFACFTHFSNFISPVLMQIFANGKQHFHSFVEFYVIHLQKSRGKNLISVPLYIKRIMFTPTKFM